MAKPTIIFGILFILLGLGGYLGTGMASPTALIPAVFGLLLLIAGLVGAAESRRKHAMHAAAMIVLLGLLGTARALGKLPALLGGGEVERPVAVLFQIVMALLCGLLLVLYIRSFVNARRARST